MFKKLTTELAFNIRPRSMFSWRRRIHLLESLQVYKTRTIYKSSNTGKNIWICCIHEFRLCNKNIQIMRPVFFFITSFWPSRIIHTTYQAITLCIRQPSLHLHSQTDHPVKQNTKALKNHPHFTSDPGYPIYSTFSKNSQTTPYKPLISTGAARLVAVTSLAEPPLSFAATWTLALPVWDRPIR